MLPAYSAAAKGGSQAALPAASATGSQHPASHVGAAHSSKEGARARQRKDVKQIIRYFLTRLRRGLGPPGEPPIRLDAVCLAALVPPVPRAVPPAKPAFRFWIDEVLWSQGRIAVELMEEVLMAAGGTRTGGPTHADAAAENSMLHHSRGGPRVTDARLGLSHVRRWDLLWTKSVYAIRAARGLAPGQVVSGLAGVNSLTMKKRMMQTLRDAYGEGGAFQLTPRTFGLPEEVGAFRAWLAAHPPRPGEVWIIKTGQDAGKGLILKPAAEALALAEAHAAADAAAGAAAAAAAASRRQRRLQPQVVQRYVADPLLIHGRKFHLRLWVTITAHAPVRAYLHRRGLVLFSSERYDAAAALEPATGAMALGHITNYARNNNSMVWSLEQLQRHMGEEVYDRLWGALTAACAKVVAAASTPLREAHAWLKPSIDNYGFQMIGMDMLIDQALHPWLLETNSAPSIMVQHTDDAAKRMIYEQKYTMLQDTINLVLGRLDQAQDKGRATAAASDAAYELAHLGQYSPLTV